MSDSLNDTNALLAQVKELFPSPVVPDIENAASYEQMMRGFIDCFQPQDFFETVLMKDVADGTWEAARCSRHKALLPLRSYFEWREYEANRRKNNAILFEPVTEYNYNRMLQATLVHLEKLAKVEAQALAKRNKALAQLEHYREGLGRSLRMVSDNFIDDQARTAAPSRDVNGTNDVHSATVANAASPQP